MHFSGLSKALSTFLALLLAANVLAPGAAQAMETNDSDPEAVESAAVDTAEPVENPEAEDIDPLPVEEDAEDASLPPEEGENGAPGAEASPAEGESSSSTEPEAEPETAVPAPEPPAGDLEEPPSEPAESVTAREDSLPTEDTDTEESREDFVPQNSIDVSETEPEILPDDAPAPVLFTNYDYKTELKKFPASYQKLLARLHKSYPNWIFIADKTGLDFQSAVAHEANCRENVFTPSICSKLMSSAVCSSYANSNTVAYYMDPRNYLNAKDVFLFVDIGASGTYTSAGEEAVLSGTAMHNNRTYYRRSGGSRVTAKLSDTYAKNMLSTGSKYGLNSYFIASKIITETGGSITYTATSGQSSSYPNIYNYYNIGAYSCAADGLRWASRGSDYNRPWNSPTRSIQGGASYINTNYYRAGQVTEYYTKFNTAPRCKHEPYSHQYMTTLYGTLNEAERMYKGYSTSGMNGKYIFHIPVYKNMPSTCSLLSVSGAVGAVSLSKGTRKAVTTRSVTMHSGPAATSSSVTTVPGGTAVTVTGGAATNNSNRAYQTVDPYWFQVSYGGKSGYISAERLTPGVSYDIARGKSRTLSKRLSNSSDKVYYLSSNPGVASVNTSGVVSARSNGTCTVYAFCGGGFDAVGVKVSARGSNIPLEKTAPVSKPSAKKLNGSNTALSLSYSTHAFTGGALTPSVTVKFGSKKLTKGKDYTVTYSGNKAPGKAAAKVTGIGNYTGSLSKTFKINALLAPYRTTTDHLNYRTGPGTSYAIKGNVAKEGTLVNVVYGWYRTVNGSKWYLAKIGGGYYYMSGNYLKREVFIKYAAKEAFPYRSGCGTSAGAKGTVKKGKSVAVVKGWNRTVSGAMWFKIRVSGHDYYAPAKSLTRSEVLSAYRTKAAVNVRSDAGTSKALQGKLLKDTPVTVVIGRKKTASGDDWYQVKVDNKYLYIMASYLSKG